jgi:putative ABC transport system permease protein
MLKIGESLAIAALGGALGIVATFPVAEAFGQAMGSLFPNFAVVQTTVWMQAAFAVAVGILAALIPARRAAAVRIVEGLRAVA